MVLFMIYDLPNRDCHAKASNGEICCKYVTYAVDMVWYGMAWYGIWYGRILWMVAGGRSVQVLVRIGTVPLNRHV